MASVNPEAESTAEEPAQDAGYQPSVRKGGIFINPWPEWSSPKLGGLFKFLCVEKDHSNVPSKQELDETLPILTPDFNELASPPERGVRVTWIGHATVLAQFDGVTMLTDPVFSKRASPLPFAGPVRYRDVPCTVEQLPKVDAVVISHNHYDHLDYPTVQKLNNRFKQELQWFVPLGLKSWMQDAGCENVTEMDWWQEQTLKTNSQTEVKFVFTPASHWCKRGPIDDNKVLWGSWTVIGPRRKFFFAGDTGYCGAFKQIRRKFGDMDVAAIPIGAYEPRWFMKPQHVNPEEAVLVHKDISAKKSVAIHWGTFNLSYEPYMEPPQVVKATMKKEGLSEDDFVILKHGESKNLVDD